MHDVKEAQELISEIRRSFHVDDGDAQDPLVENFENAVNILSDQLYNKPTRFILELIQNADDNQYPDDEPRLAFIYRRDGYLWVGNNETGFTAENVRALCAIGKSSKKGFSGKKGYIGEKGIGFKSVFKVADMVWVRSGALQFQFDKHAKLGMVAPRWCAFQSHKTLDMRTMFCFKIPDDDHRQAILKDLKSLSGRMLMFLRKLKVIEVHVEDASGSIRETSFRLDCTTQPYHESFDLARLTCRTFAPQRHSTISSFLTTYCIVEDMPCNEHRHGICSSEMHLAFPVAGGGNRLEPRVVSQQTYNFLPIRSYGLRFMIQADFILSASREDIQEGVEWNKKLLKAARGLFVRVIKDLNRREVLKYTWPRYLGSTGSQDGTIFEGFLKELITSLRSENVLESLKWSLRSPKEMVVVPSIFMDGQKPPMPVLAPAMDLHTCTQTTYGDDDLMQLEVPSMSSEYFISLLEKLLRSEPTVFRSATNAWHSRLAKALLWIGSSSVRHLAILPLRDGRWVSSGAERLYFPSVSEGTKLPLGIEANIMDDEAVADDSRKRLFIELDVQNLNTLGVCELILNQHNRHTSSLDSISVDTIVSHAWFLYLSSPKVILKRLARLRIVDRNGNVSRAEDIYMDGPSGDFKISEVFGDKNTTIKHIHGRYALQAPDSLRSLWHDWLRKVGVRTLPALVDPGTLTFSNEFQWLLHNRNSSVWLNLLRDYWKYYLSDISQLGGYETYLPAESILLEPFAKHAVPLVDLKGSVGPDDRRWEVLKAIGLNTAPDLQFYITILEHLRKGNAEVTIDDVRRIYSGIQQHLESDRLLVKRKFDQQDLVYIPTTPLGAWVNISRCRWALPQKIGSLVALETSYPQHQPLFESIAPTGPDIVDCVVALEQLSGREDSVSTIKDLLFLLDTMIREKRSGVKAISRLNGQRMKIIPVTGTQGKLRSLRDKDWFVADREALKSCFDGCVAFFDFTEVELKSLSDVMVHLKLTGREISAFSLEKTETTGKPSYDSLLTSLLRSKSKHLSRLGSEDRVQYIYDQVMRIEVWSSQNLLLKRYVNIDGTQVYGKDSRGFVNVAIHESRIYVEQLACALPAKLVSEALALALGVSKQRESLLFAVLATEDDEQIEYMLEKENVKPSLIPDSASERTAKASSDADVPKFEEESHMIPAAQDSSLGPPLMLTPEKAVGATRSPRPVTPHASPHGTPVTRSRSPLRPVSSFIDLSTLKTAAKDSELATISLIAPRHEEIEQAEQPVLQQSSRSMQSSAMPAIGPGQSLAAPSSDVFDMRAVITALDSVAPSMNKPSFSARSSQRLQALPQEFPRTSAQATNFEKEIGYGGEVYVYHMLQAHFKIDKDCWTSNMRSQFGLGRFEGQERDFSDFTIKDSSICNHVTNWLANRGIETAAQWSGGDLTYHFEVKATMGSCEEPFILSNNQMDLARTWHSSPSDVYAILRVYNLTSSPALQIYLDPYAQIISGSLHFAAQGGYLVQPA